MPPALIVRLAAFFYSLFRICFLATLLGMAGMHGVVAQQPTDSELLKVSFPKPNSTKKLALEEYLTVVVRCANKSNNPVRVSADPCISGRSAGAYGFTPEVVESKNIGTVNIRLTCKVPTVADEIKVTMWDTVTNQQLAVISVPVQITWDGKPAQQPAKSELEVSSLRPKSTKKLALGELLPVVVQYKKKSANSVIVSVIPHTNGLPTPGYKSVRWRVSKDSGTADMTLTCTAPAVVNEIKVTMTDEVTKQELAVIGVPVRMTWGDVKPASIPSPPPATMAKLVAGQPGMLRFELKGYEVSQDDAATLFIAQPAEFDPKAMHSATASLLTTRKATLVNLPFIQAFSGARAIAAPVGGYTLEAQLTLGADKRTVEAVCALRRASDQSGMVLSVLSQIQGVTFVGSLPGSSADTVVLAFSRITQL